MDKARILCISNGLNLLKPEAFLPNDHSRSVIQRFDTPRPDEGYCDE